MKEHEIKTFPLLARFKKEDKVLEFELKRGIKDYPKLWEAVKK